MSWIYYEGAWQENKKEDAYEKELIIVGADKEDIVINVEQGRVPILTVSFQGNKYSGSIKERAELPNGTTEKDVSSTYKDGVLTLIVKKPVKNIRRVAIG